MVLRDIFSIKKTIAKIDELLFRREDRALNDVVNTSDTDQLIHILETIPHGRKKLFTLLDPHRAVDVLKRLSPYIRQYVLHGSSPERIQSLMANMESDEIADMINLLSGQARENILIGLRKHDPKQVLALVNQRNDTAGGLMKTEMIVGKPETTVREFTQNLKDTFPNNIPKSSYVYVVDDHGRLMGIFNFNKLHLAKEHITLKTLMHSRIKTVKVDEDQEEVARKFSRYDAIELPVVTKTGLLVGRISADDIIRVLRNEFSEDIYRLVGAFGGGRADVPYWQKVKRRFPWLLVNLGTAIMAASVVSVFTDTISRFVILAAYMPIIAGMGGNAATQSLGVTIRAIALDEITELNAWKVIFKEILAGATNGAVIGVIIGGIAYLLNGNIYLSFVLFVSMTLNLFIAGLGGTLIPLIMKTLKIDPALASTVFVTTLTDVFGFLTFLGLASVLL